MGNFFFSYFSNSILAPPKNIVFPFGSNDKLMTLAHKFKLEPKDLIEFHKTFRRMDSQGTGYINLDSLYGLIEEELSSIISPYLERLFLLIEKENQDKITFIEWLPPTAVFCLYTSEKIIGFVFNMIDTDQDNFISKKDMIKFLTMERFGKKIFPYNHVKAIELMDLPRSDKINLEQFKKVHQIALFLCFPAFKLQERLRNRVIGETFWENLYKKIHEDETDENKKKQRSKMEEEKKKKQLQKTEKNAKKFEEKMKGVSLEQGLWKGKKNMKIREAGRRSSDSKIEIKNVPDIPDMKENNKPRKSPSVLYIKSEMVIQKEKAPTKDKKNRDVRERRATHLLTGESNPPYEEDKKGGISTNKLAFLQIKK